MKEFLIYTKSGWVAVFVLMFSAVLFCANAGADFAERKIGDIVLSKGNALIENRRAVFSAVESLPIEKNDIASTENNSLLQVQLTDKTRIGIGENSRFVFDRYRYGTGRKSELRMVLKSGFFRIKSGEIAKKSPQNYHIQVGNSVIGVRGTEFYALINDSGEEIGCISGKILIRSQKKIYELKAGNMLFRKKKSIWLKRKIQKDFGRSKLIDMQRHIILSRFSTRNFINRVPQRRFLPGSMRKPGQRMNMPGNRRMHLPANRPGRFKKRPSGNGQNFSQAQRGRNRNGLPNRAKEGKKPFRKFRQTRDKKEDSPLHRKRTLPRQGKAKRKRPARRQMRHIR